MYFENYESSRGKKLSGLESFLALKVGKNSPYMHLLFQNISGRLCLPLKWRRGGMGGRWERRGKLRA
jgi:hypothetical protein